MNQRAAACLIHQENDANKSLSEQNDENSNVEAIIFINWKAECASQVTAER